MREQWRALLAARLHEHWAWAFEQDGEFGGLGAPTLTGSLALALAVASGEMSVDAAWTAAHVDEDFQMRTWGADAEALALNEPADLEAFAKTV